MSSEQTSKFIHNFKKGDIVHFHGARFECIEHHPKRQQMEAALLWTLWHHQGGSSHIGQPIRKLLGIGQHDRLTDEQIAQAKEFFGEQK